MVCSGQHVFERLYLYGGIHTRRDIRVGVGPCLRADKTVELRNDQAAAETGGAGVFAVDGRMGPCQQQATFIFQLLQSCNMSGPCRQACVEAARMVLNFLIQTDDCWSSLICGAMISAVSIDSVSVKPIMLHSL
jgi:hypothetical protein